MTEEQSHANKRVAAVVQGGINHASVALAANHCIHLVHLGGDIHLAHRREIIGAAVGLSYVAQGAAGRNVAHSGALLVLQDIVGNGHQGIFLAKRLAVLANQRQTVHIGVYADAKVGIVGHNCLAQAHQIGRQRLGVVGKMARRLTVYGDALHAQLLQQARHNHAAHRIHRVQHNLEVRRLYGSQVHQRIGLHGVDVDLGIIFI